LKRATASARDSAAQSAAERVLADGANAVDAVLAGMLAGATRATRAALLGSGVVFVGGTGMGAFAVDGRARAPGLRARRPTAPSEPPSAWRAAVPGLLEGVLAAHHRFGSASWGSLVRSAVIAIRDHDDDAGALGRASVVEALAGTGMHALERLGIVQDTLEIAGVAAGGLFTRDDLAPFAPRVIELTDYALGDQRIRAWPDEPRPSYRPADPPAAEIDGIMCADMLGGMSVGVWLVAPEAVALPGPSGLSIAALCAPPTRDVPRWRPGSEIPMQMPAAFVERDGRVWAALLVAGTGDAAGVRDAVLRARMQVAPAGPPGRLKPFRGLVSWLVRDADGPEVRVVSEAVNGE